jgi:FtsZ-interacting cell division protein ZipA
MEGLLRKQQMYEKMLTDAQRQADELERIIASEKRDMLLKKLNEINEQIKLVNQSAQTS